MARFERPVWIFVLPLSAALFSLGLLAASELGLAWDEANFIPSGFYYIEAIQDWLRDPWNHALGKDDRWQWTWEHPPLVKLGSATSLILFHGSFGALLAARLPLVFLLAALPMIGFFLGREMGGNRTGFWTAGALAAFPRLMGHLVVVGLDGPLTVGCLTFLLFYSRSLRATQGLLRSVWIPVLLLALCLLIKFNAFFLVPVAALWSLRDDPRCFWKKPLMILCLGLLVGFMGYPYLWHDPIPRVTAYLFSKFSRSSIPVHYLGQTYASSMPNSPAAPWHYPLVMLLATTPPVLLLASLIGTWASLRNRSWILPFFTLCFLLPCCWPSTPKYDGVRLFLPAVGGLAVMGGMGMDQISRYLNDRLHVPVSLTAFAFLLLAATQILRIHPYYLSYYSPLVGGLPGAQRLGFELTYWGECLRPSALREAQKRTHFQLLRVDPIGENVCALSRNLGLLPSDLTMVRLEESKDPDPSRAVSEDGTVVALVSRQGKFEDPHWKLYKEQIPFMTIDAEGTPLVRFYKQEQWDEVCP